ncbi:hypothetical protein HPP92_011496 [Vanilla planifolia]|uniref:Protein kinase domain-containing protein n=1 Tax=Vanilla planifolia TaxID=51239 RepID=A0A835V2V7_VANPL|nr:hypothetical protein HPP92_011496 [Vanilla planifolia]
MVCQAALRPPQPLLLTLLTVTFLFSSTTAGPEEGAVLLRFKSTLSGVTLLSWMPNAAPCSVNSSTWEGVICLNGRVWGLKLEEKGIAGGLELAVLAGLRGLRTISFMRNQLEGPMPEVGRLGALKTVYLSNNRFSGEIPNVAFAGMRSLKKLFLSNNRFSGPIPTSLTGPAKMIELRLDHNGFCGRIPDFRQPRLESVNVSFNNLDGPIPERLSKMDPSLFQANDKLCGAPLATACDTSGQRKKGISGWLLAVIILACIAAVALFVILLALCRKQWQATAAQTPTSQRSTSVDEADRMERGAADPQPEGRGGAVGKKGTRENEHGRLTFVQEGRERFELQDLLRASAEVLGSGNFGASYKATLAVGPTMVVKRFKEMNGVGREDFNEHMRRIGRLSHPNVLPLVAYYYKKEEKLLVSDFAANGSLAHVLHGNRGSNLPPLDWPTRLKIVKGVARGLAYLYDELPVLTLPHGHLKSSNVLLNDAFDPLLADYALSPVVNAAAVSQCMVAYKSPEAAQFGSPSKKSDVWSLGILVLEIITGEFPANFFNRGNTGAAAELAAWVGTVARGWSGEDVEGEAREEMRMLVEIGVECCEADVDKRPDMREALERISRIGDTGDVALSS